MIFIALLIHLMGNYIPRWINKKRSQNSTHGCGWRMVLLKLSGTITDFAVAFIIILIITIAVKGKELLNENAIYGVECDSLAKEIGFMDGDKIISINDKKVIKFFDIAKQIILEPDSANVKIRRGEKDTIITIAEKERYKILTNKKHFSLFTPKLKPDSITGVEPKQLVYTESKRGLNDAFHTYDITVKEMYLLIKPISSEEESLGGYISISKITSISGWFFILAIDLIFIGLFNLLPLPGFGVGNAIIAFIEAIRKKVFNRKRLRIIRIACISLLIAYYFFAICFTTNFFN
jgi:membrane-associated protease RseP (regulator of RpoE activity)